MDDWNRHQSGSTGVHCDWNHLTSRVGRVELTGLVIEHEVGYRASHARITDLLANSPETARALMDRYPDVNVRVEESRRVQ